MTRIEKVSNWTFLWGARVALAVLAVAGTIHLTAGVDSVIQYPLTVAFVALLLRETL